MANKKTAIYDTIEITIPAKPKFLKIIRQTMNYVCKAVGFAQDEINNITLAVDEANSNIIKHAYKRPTNRPIQMKIILKNDQLQIHIRDFGKKIDIKKIKSRQLDDVRPGVLGVHLIKTVMDEVIYDNSLQQGNQLKLVKYITKNQRG